MVRARSAAEIPVVTPSAASIETVKLVLNFASLRSDISGNASCWQRASDKVKQTKPRAWVIIKLISSGRTWVAAMMISPSFSRSSSSIKMTILPARMSSIISGIVFKLIGSLNILLCIDGFDDKVKLLFVYCSSRGHQAL